MRWSHGPQSGNGPERVNCTLKMVTFAPKHSGFCTENDEFRKMTNFSDRTDLAELWPARLTAHPEFGHLCDERGQFSMEES